MEQLLQEPLTEFEEWNADLNKDTGVSATVWCLTYNHVNYIREAMESFLAQKTKFSFEIIVFDDASTDGTSDIVREYAKKHPHMVKAFIAKKNTYRRKEREEFIKAWQRKFFRGKYMAWCEGDDYWIDPYKLQIQIDYMESHPDCVLYLHNGVKMDYQKHLLESINPYSCSGEKDLCAEELIMQYVSHPPTASSVYRTEVAVERPKLFYHVPVGDYPMQLYAYTQGKIHYSSRIMSVYRWFHAGSYNNRLFSDKEMAFYFNFGLLFFLTQYDKYTDYRYHLWIRNKIQGYALGAVESTDLEMPLEKHYEICEEQGYHFYPVNKEYIKELEKLRKQVFDMTYCTDSVKSFAKNHKRLVIMGKGAFGLKIAQQFENNHIKYDGFAVSNKAEEDGRGRLV